MRRLWRWSGATAVRQLVSAPGGRRLTVVLFIAGLWFAWWVIPASPAVRWECPAGQHDYFELTHDGRTILHRAQPDNDNLIFFQMPANPVRACDADTGRQRFELSYPADMNAHLSCVSPDGSWLLVEGKDGHDACLLDATDGHELVRFPGNDRIPLSVRVAPNGRELAVTPPDKAEIRLWDLAAGTVRMVLPGAKRVAAYSPDGQRLATITWDDSTIWPGCQDRISVSVWNVATGRELGRRDWPAVASMDFKFSPDGRWVAALWERLVPGRHGHETMGFESFTPETAVPGAGMLWAVTTGATLTLAEFTDSSRMNGIEFTPDGQWVVLRTRTGPRFWDLRSSPPAPWAGPANWTADWPYPFFIPATDRMVLPGDDLATLDVWSTADMTRRALCQLRFAERSAQMTASADGSTLAVMLSGSSPLYARVTEFLQKHIGFPKTVRQNYLIQWFDTQTGAERATFHQTGNSRLLGFSPDGRTLWTSAFVADSADGKYGMAVIRGWAMESPWPRAWLFALTAAAILFAVFDWRRSRGRVAGGMP